MVRESRGPSPSVRKSATARARACCHSAPNRTSPAAWRRSRFSWSEGIEQAPAQRSRRRGQSTSPLEGPGRRIHIAGQLGDRSGLELFGEAPRGRVEVLSKLAGLALVAENGLENHDGIDRAHDAMEEERTLVGSERARNLFG